MADVVIQNPVINSPFEKPERHFEFGERGITGIMLKGRRDSSFFVPIPQGRRQTAQLSLEAEWTRDRLRANELVNRIREKVAVWRKGGYAGVTRPTGMCDPPTLQWDQGAAGVVTWRGVEEPLNRLLLGMTETAFNRLVGAGVAPDAAYEILLQFAPLAHAAMPVQDAIDLVYYLAKVACGYVRFAPGPPTVAGPIDIAAITKHEQYRWVRRKHYYKLGLNPIVDPHRGIDPAT